MTRPGGIWQNWARTEHIRPQYVEYPSTIEAVRRSVRAAATRGRPIKAVGAGHSFTGIAVAPGTLLELTELSGLVSVDRERSRARLLAGTRLHRIPALLAPYGLAMTNLGDIDRQSIAGAISTGTHGTGARFGGLSTQIVGATLVTADGELLTVDEDHEPELLPAVALGLGALGILVDVTIQCVPTFVLQAIERPEALDEVVDNVIARADAVDHFEFYWFPHTDVALTKTNTRLPADATTAPLSRASRIVDDLIVGNGVHQAVCSAGRAVPALVPRINRMSARVWGDRSFSDASHRVFATSRGVRFREMEYAVPVENLAAAFRGVQQVIDDNDWRIEFPVEVRVAAADDLWLSTAAGRASGYIAVHRYWRADPTAYFTAVEQIMLAHGGRPHWGKMHTLDASALRGRYPRFDDFVALRDRLDPDRRFGNPYLRRVLGE
ncbi:MAG: FAD-linked oxidoreductase [Microbacterium sp. SCN 70-200]|uniref:D-arabinono-1,4-lactone oxidase n=1 Tax=unclassified Microbacterium TaxID=2609290 RepID=UPI000869F064|nr:MULTISPECIES: D-arabinono-1,4-lactone oxidase [unclassified Microbacterium]MBN9213324.1 FAD-binding protein [Microbacterium sp.]ODT40553.1 MAG: FAD-linked oxidoreductase [Microbacterium sp. SCN 70-200]OJV84975.1 MAG: FAD-linked oxidoreductase [Microbacterium sp. 70-16]